MIYTNVAAIGMSKEDGISKPISKFRTVLLFPFRMLLRSLLFVWGFHWVSVKGKKASAKDAPVICPNHVSFIEPLWIVYANTPMSVGAYATMMFPGFSKAHKMLQNIPLEKYLEPNSVDNVYSREWVKVREEGVGGAREVKE
jgi:lysophosphatidylcholine acyltransferase/lyso-PAF acetyltransferase